VGTHRRRDTKEIRVTAKEYEYDPAVITVKHGDRVRLVVTAVDHDHGLKIEAFHIDQLVKKGESTAIEFKTNLTGTFPFQCSHFCGLGHKGMKGELIVEEAPHASQEERLRRGTLLFLEAEDSERDIQFCINSPGGSITAGMRFMTHDAVRTPGCGDDVRRRGRFDGCLAIDCGGSHEALLAA
jgi:cytochrome c oxidase subunit II